MIGFPLLIIPFAIYNMIAFLTPFDWNAKLYSFRLPSGLVFEPTASDAFILFSLLMLMFEVIKSTKHGRSLVEHFLTLLLVCGAAAEFAMVNPAQVMSQQNVPQQMGNSTFALFVAICVVDLFAGFAAATAPRAAQGRGRAGAGCRGARARPLWCAPSPPALSRPRVSSPPRASSRLPSRPRPNRW